MYDKMKLSHCYCGSDVMQLLLYINDGKDV